MKTYLVFCGAVLGLLCVFFFSSSKSSSKAYLPDPQVKADADVTSFVLTTKRNAGEIETRSSTRRPYRVSLIPGEVIPLPFVTKGVYLSDAIPDDL